MKQRSTKGLRKMLAGLCMFGMVFMTCFGAMPVNAQEGTKLTAAACTAERGKTAAVTFTLQGNPGIWALKFRVGYDHSALTLTSVTNGTVFSDGDVTPPENLNKERFVYLASASQLENISANGTIVTLNFSVADSAELQSYPITLEVTQAINVEGEEINIDAQNGSVTVKMNEPKEISEPDQSNEPDHTSQDPTDNTPEAPADNTGVISPVNNSGQTVRTSDGPAKTENAKKREAPKTADNSSPAVWALFTLVSGGTTFALVVSDKKRKRNKA